MSSETSDRIGEQVLARVPGVAEIWHRRETDFLIDLRLRLVDDSWDAREAAIDAMLELASEHLDDVLINFSFVLPDVADETEDAEEVISHAPAQRVHSFV